MRPARDNPNRKMGAKFVSPQNLAEAKPNRPYGFTTPVVAGQGATIVLAHLCLVLKEEM